MISLLVFNHCPMFQNSPYHFKCLILFLNILFMCQKGHHRVDGKIQGAKWKD